MLDRRALTPEQKKQVMDEVLIAWLQKPELRLGQLLENALSKHETQLSLFYVEDLDLTKHLKEWVHG